MAHKTSRLPMTALTAHDVKSALDRIVETDCPDMRILAASIFHGSPYAMLSLAKLFYAMCQDPIEFGHTQRRFYEALLEAGAFEDWTPASREPAMQVHVMLPASTEEAARKMDVCRTAFKLGPFMIGMHAVLMSPEMRNFAEWVNYIPMRIASAFLFYTENVHLSIFPARRWLIDRLLVPGCYDANLWMTTDTANALVQSEYALEFSYLPSAGFGSEQPRNMNPSVIMTMHQLEMANPVSVCSTLNGPDTEVRDDENKRDKHINVMVSLMMNRLLAFNDPAYPCVDVDSKVSWIRRHMELALWMLGGYSVGTCLDLIARTISPEMLCQLQSIVEEMRAYMLKPLGRPVDPFIKHLAKSTAQTLNTQANILSICQLLTKASRRRSGLTPRYVGTREVNFFDFVTGLMRDYQLGQLNSLTKWCQNVQKSHSFFPDIDRMLREGPDGEYTAMLNRGVSVWRVPPSVHRARLAWSLDLICEVTPGLPSLDKLSVLVGYDNIGGYLVMPRPLMTLLRMRMIVLSLVSSTFVKTTAWYPVLVQLLVCSYVDPDKPRSDAEPFVDLISEPIDDYARYCVAAVVAHWLRIPKRGTNSNSGEYEGMPAIGSFAAKMYEQLHNVAEMLFRPVCTPAVDTGRPKPLDVTEHMPQLNALRSFIMIASPHYLPLTVIRAIAGTDYVANPSLGVNHLSRLNDLIEAMRALSTIYESDAESTDASSPASADIDTTSDSSTASGNPGKRGSPTPAPNGKRPRGRPPSAARSAAASAAAKQSLFHDSKHLVGSTSGVTTQQFLSMLRPENQLHSCADDASRNALLNAMVYEFCIASGREDWMMAFCVSSRVVMDDYARALYQCSIDSLDMWRHSSDCIRQGLSEQAQRPTQDRYRLLSCFLPSEEVLPQTFDMLIDVLGSLEFSVCQRHVPKTKSNSKKGARAGPKHIHDNERNVAARTGEIRAHMADYYARRSGGAFPMPVSCSMTQEDEVCVVELLNSLLLVDISSDQHSQATLASDVSSVLDPDRAMRSSNRNHLVSPLLLSTLGTFGPFFPTPAALRARTDSTVVFRQISRQQASLKIAAGSAAAPPPSDRQSGV